MKSTKGLPDTAAKIRTAFEIDVTMATGCTVVVLIALTGACSGALHLDTNLATFHDAQQICHDNGTALHLPESDKENQDLVELLMSNNLSDAWIGWMEFSNGSQTLDGVEVSYANFVGLNSTMRDGSYCVLVKSDGSWGADECNTTLSNVVCYTDDLCIHNYDPNGGLLAKRCQNCTHSPWGPYQQECWKCPQSIPTVVDIYRGCAAPRGIRIRPTHGFTDTSHIEMQSLDGSLPARPLWCIMVASINEYNMFIFLRTTRLDNFTIGFTFESAPVNEVITWQVSLLVQTDGNLPSGIIWILDENFLHLGESSISEIYPLSYPQRGDFRLTVSGSGLTNRSRPESLVRDLWGTMAGLTDYWHLETCDVHSPINYVCRMTYVDGQADGCNEDSERCLEDYNLQYNSTKVSQCYDCSATLNISDYQCWVCEELRPAFGRDDALCPVPGRLDVSPLYATVSATDVRFISDRDIFTSSYIWCLLELREDETVIYQTIPLTRISMSELTFRTFESPNRKWEGLPWKMRLLSELPGQTLVGDVWHLAETFTFYGEPSIGSIYPLNSTLAGGIRLTVNGTNFEPVEDPYILVTMWWRNLYGADFARNFTEDCEVLTNTQIVCLTPQIQPPDDLLEAINSSSESDAPLNTDALEFHVQILLYNDIPIPISNTSTSNVLRVFGNPVIYKMDPYVTLVDGSNVTIKIMGDRMNLGATIDDYRVGVGEVGVCDMRTLVSNALHCIPPTRPLAQTYRNTKFEVKVEVGRSSFLVGYLRYDRDKSLHWPGIAGGVAGALVLVACVSACICRRRVSAKRNRQNQKDKQIELS